MPLISEIELPDKSYKYNADGKKSDRLKNLSKVNVFVGANNNGKSRLLRTLFSNELNFKPNNDHIDLINKVLQNLRNNFKIDDTFTEISGLYLDPYFKSVDLLRTNEYLKVNSAVEKLEELNKLYKDSLERKKNSNLEEYPFDEDIQEFNYSSSLLKDLKQHLNKIKLIYPFRSVYIPILRGLRPINYKEIGSRVLDSYDSYEKRTLDDYFPDLKKTSCIFTGLKTYEYFNDYISHEDDKKQDAIEEYESFLSKNFFDNQRIKIIPVNPKDHNSNNLNIVKIRIGNEEGKMIYDLGDGIQSIIVMTFPLFLYKSSLEKDENLLVFIEEPEQHIHPGLQRRLLETFINYEGFKNYQFFITTHSPSFMDITSNFDKISLFSVHKEHNGISPQFTIENQLIKDKDALELIGVRSIPVLSNCMILVEGFTDRVYLKHYFNIYQKANKKVEFYEDHHYSFLEYCGDSIANSFLLNDKHYSKSVLRLKNSVFVIMDGDKTDSKNAVKLGKKLGDNFCLLSCKEIENLVSKEVLLKYLTDIRKYDQKELYNSFKEPNYQKNDCKLENFINKRVLSEKSKKFKMEKKKIDFCSDILSLVRDESDLSNLTLDLCEDIYKFIEKQNIAT